jgi:hypothetical protein
MARPVSYLGFSGAGLTTRAVHQVNASTLVVNANANQDRIFDTARWDRRA